MKLITATLIGFLLRQINYSAEHIYKCKNGQTERQADRQTYVHTHTQKKKASERGRERERENDKEKTGRCTLENEVTLYMIRPLIHSILRLARYHFAAHFLASGRRAAKLGILMKE